MINVLVVTTNAQYVSFQADSFMEAAKRIDRMLFDKQWYPNMKDDSPVFVRNLNRPDGVMSQYTAQAFVTEFYGDSL